MTLLKDWLCERKFYVDINGNHSTLHSDDYGTIQGSVLGPVLFSIFIRPIYKIEDLTTYADDNYLGADNIPNIHTPNILGETLYSQPPTFKD